MVDQAVDDGALPIAAIVLAAGFSRRLGRPKQTVQLGGETLLERTVRVARAARLHPVLPVINIALAQDEALLAQLAALGAYVLVNTQAEEGMASSIRCGLRELTPEAVRGVVLLTCDQIAVSASHIAALCENPGKAAASGYAGRVGVPAYFPAERFSELRALEGDQGARALLQHARVVSTQALALDVDTEEDVKRAEAWLSQR